jgi:hypothetical protein|tara:strand:- start:178 stop:399 length:222 start_codon:yes stop_codon:yes gene_type:complete
MIDLSEEALKLDRIQIELEAVQGELSPHELTDELLKKAEREGISFKSFLYLERTLITLHRRARVAAYKNREQA